MNTRKSKYTEDLLRRLIELNLQIKAAKPLYAQYDELLEKVLAIGEIPQRVPHKGLLWHVRVTDGFAQANTQWKSVAQRRFDISAVPIGKPDAPPSKRLKKLVDKVGKSIPKAKRK